MRIHYLQWNRLNGAVSAGLALVVQIASGVRICTRRRDSPTGTYGVSEHFTPQLVQIAATGQQYHRGLRVNWTRGAR
ncbi:MAG: hypothetical protein ACE5G5_12070 [Candidatus Methylomirabilales bacterium]